MTNTDDIRVKVAEAMGFVRVPVENFKKFPLVTWPVWEKDGRRYSTYTESLPFYPTDHNAAFTLCDRLKSEGWRWRASTEDTHSETCFQFVNDEFAFEATAASLPMAICLAFLKVMESQIPLLTNPPSTD